MLNACYSHTYTDCFYTAVLHSSMVYSITQLMNTILAASGSGASTKLGDNHSIHSHRTQYDRDRTSSAICIRMAHSLEGNDIELNQNAHTGYPRRPPRASASHLQRSVRIRTRSICQQQKKYWQSRQLSSLKTMHIRLTRRLSWWRR